MMLAQNSCTTFSAFPDGQHSLVLTTDETPGWAADIGFPLWSLEDE